MPAENIVEPSSKKSRRRGSMKFPTTERKLVVKRGETIALVVVKSIGCRTLPCPAGYWNLRGVRRRRSGGINRYIIWG